MPPNYFAVTRIEANFDIELESGPEPLFNVFCGSLLPLYFQIRRSILVFSAARKVIVRQFANRLRPKKPGRAAS